MQTKSLTKIFSTNYSQKYSHQSDISCNQNLSPKYSPPINHRNIANNLIIISSKISHQNIIAIINCQKQLPIVINLAAVIVAWSKIFLWGIKNFEVESLRVLGLLGPTAVIKWHVCQRHKSRTQFLFSLSKKQVSLSKLRKLKTATAINLVISFLLSNTKWF